MKKEELRNVPLKNYIILGVVLIVTMFLLYYFCMWVDVYNENKINRPILDRYMEVINYNELDNYIVENPNTIIYVSVLEDERIRKFEIELKNSFKEGKIEKDVLYLDLTNEMKDKTMISNIKNKYSLNSLDITSVPCILVIEEGKLKGIYSVKDNGYDVNKLEVFINNIKIDIGE